MLEIRIAQIQDKARILEIYEIAREFMQRTGNPHQWGTALPTEDSIQKDIELQRSIVVYDAAGIHGVCAVCAGKDATYQNIENGAWLNEQPYLTLHRIAGDGERHGIFRAISDYCKTQSENLRIDTHEDNRIMQKLIVQNGFQKCGIIYVADGTSRIAYQWKKCFRK